MKTELVSGKRRVVIYCRISDDREGRKYGVRRQERDCRKMAAELGVDVVAVLIENDTSAYSGKPRPKYAQLMEMLRSGEADGVLALTSRRLQRRYREAFDFLDLVQEKDILVATVKGGRYDLTTADGRREARRKAVDDQHEAEEIGERVRDAKKDNVREGTYRGGPRPFGYESDGTTPRSLLCPGCDATDGFFVAAVCAKCKTGDSMNIDRICEACDTGEGFTATARCGGCQADAVLAEFGEAWYAAQAADAVLAGQSLRSIRVEWKDKGVLTAERSKRLPDGTRTEAVGAEWTEATLRNMLLRPRNAGLLEVDGEIVGKAAWPAILPEEKWRALRTVLTNPDRRTTPGPTPKWLGSGLYRCGIEGCTQTVRSAGRATRTGASVYVCRTPGHLKRDAQLLDAYVERTAVERLSRPDALHWLLPPAPHEEPAEQLASRAEALRAKLDQYGIDYDNDVITRKQMLDGTARTRTKLAEVEAQMDSRTRGSALADLPLGTPDMETAWKAYTLGRKRAIIDTILTVTILPGKGGRPRGHVPGQPYFRPECVRIEPKRPHLSLVS